MYEHNDISKIRLNYQVERFNYADVVNESMACIISRHTCKHQLDMGYGGGSLPPGAKVVYWWIIE
jgi:hypothetical protein